VLITPTLLGSLIAGVACWLLFWFGVSHVDSIPFLNRYLSKDMIMEWVRQNPVQALLITELINVLFHGIGSASAVFFTFSGTLVNACVIFGVIPTCTFIEEQIKSIKEKALEFKAEVEAKKRAA